MELYERKKDKITESIYSLYAILNLNESQLGFTLHVHLYIAVENVGPLFSPSSPQGIAPLAFLGAINVFLCVSHRTKHLKKKSLVV